MAFLLFSEITVCFVINFDDNSLLISANQDDLL